jgi:SAM-dependent methyltransferase
LQDKEVLVCNICGGTHFSPGFQGRLTQGKMPMCDGCHSLERHRIVYNLYSAISSELTDCRALQFAPDASISKDWFSEYVGSVYGSANSYNMMDTGLEAGRFEFVISNHVLEHVPDDIQAIKEMVRVSGPDGIVSLTIPTPTMRWETVDWGWADPEINYHYRDYGADFPQRIANAIPDLQIVSASGRDPVTGIHDIVYFISSSEARLKSMAGYWAKIPVPLARHAS